MKQGQKSLRQLIRPLEQGRVRDVPNIQDVLSLPAVVFGAFVVMAIFVVPCVFVTIFGGSVVVMTFSVSFDEPFFSKIMTNKSMNLVPSSLTRNFVDAMILLC